MHERPDPDEARARLDAFVARAKYPATAGPDVEELGEQARQAAELLDDQDGAQIADERAQGTDVEALPAVDVEQLAAELGVDPLR